MTMSNELGPRREPLLRRILTAVRRWFNPPPPPEPEPLPDPVYGVETYRSATETYTVPAQGYVFNFQVRLAFTWTSEGLSPQSLAAWSRELLPQVRREARCAVARYARDYLPHDVQALDARAALEFRHKVWQFVVGGMSVTCRTHVRVMLEENVRAHLEQYWQERLTMEADHANKLRHAELVEQRHQRWLALLDKLRDSPLAASAASLTDQDFAVVVKEMTREQNELLEQLSRRMMADYGHPPLADDSTDREFVAGLFGNLDGPDAERPG